MSAAGEQPVHIVRCVQCTAVHVVTAAQDSIEDHKIAAEDSAANAGWVVAEGNTLRQLHCPAYLRVGPYWTNFVGRGCGQMGLKARSDRRRQPRPARLRTLTTCLFETSMTSTDSRPSAFELMHKRATAARAAARTRGRHTGRPPRLTLDQVRQVRKLRAGGESIGEFVAGLSVSRATIYRARLSEGWCPAQGHPRLMSSDGAATCPRCGLVWRLADTTVLVTLPD